MSDATKKCSRCGETKVLSEFSPDRRATTGRSCDCNVCRRASSREYYKKNSEARKRANRIYLKSPERAAWLKEYYKSDRYKELERARYSKPSRKEVRKAVCKRHNEKYTDKYKARYALTNAVQLGHIVRPNSCSLCGKVGPVEGHHAWGYMEACWLRVSWLCVKCHKESDRIAKNFLNTHLALTEAMFS